MPIKNGQPTYILLGWAAIVIYVSSASQNSLVQVAEYVGEKGKSDGPLT